MMRETSLDEHATADGLEKSVGSISLSQHRQSTRLQRDIGNHRNGVCSRNEMDEARTNESQTRVADEEKKAEESEMKPKTTLQTRILTPQRRVTPQSNSAMPHQDYLRHVTTDGTKKAGTSWWERVVVQRSSYVVEDLVEQYTADSQFLHSDPFPIAWMDRIELETGDLLGSGTYSNVYRVQSLDLLPDFLKDHDEQDGLRKELLARCKPKQASSDEDDELESPSMAATGYAIKHLKSELLQNSKLFEAAAADLIMEAKFLSRLSHPNILRLRGMALGGSSAFSTTGLFDSYFLVVDELEETLIQRIHRWKIEGSTDQYQHNMILYKLKLAVQVASALAYLHARRLVFRDLKPHNIGLKSDGTIQLFDFGFCRELPAPDAAVSRQHGRSQQSGNQSMAGGYPQRSTEDDDDEELIYCMSGKGTLLYMASEVLSSRCYNQKADVYSWSMVTYELLTLQKPFAVGSIEQHKKAVCDRGQRPPLHHLRWLSSGVKELLQHSWQANVQARWPMKDVKDALDDIISELESTRPPFSSSRDSSFGYSKPSSFFCQGMEMDSIILDITNTMQTRYQYITNQLFCQGSTKDVSSTNATAPESSSGGSNTNGSKRQSDTASTQKTRLEEESKSSKAKSEVPAAVEAGKEAAANAARPPAAGKEEHKDEAHFSAVASISMSTRIWGGSVKGNRSTSTRPRIWGGGAKAPLIRPQRAEQFPMTSLCMHSERLNAARSRQNTSLSSSSPRVASLNDLKSSKDFSSRLRARRSSISHLPQTSEQGESIEMSSQDDLDHRSGMLQTIRSEDEEKSMDEVELEEEEEDSKTDVPTKVPEEVGAAEAGSQSVRLPEADTQYEPAQEGGPPSDAQQEDPTNNDDATDLPEKKKKAGNPQDDQSAQSGAFIVATASV